MGKTRGRKPTKKGRTVKKRQKGGDPSDEDKIISAILKPTYSPEEVRNIINNIYEKNGINGKDIDRNLKRYEGKERQLVGILMKKYAIHVNGDIKRDIKRSSTPVCDSISISLKPKKVQPEDNKYQEHIIDMFIQKPPFDDRAGVLTLRHQIKPDGMVYRVIDGIQDVDLSLFNLKTDFDQQEKGDEKKKEGEKDDGKKRAKMPTKAFILKKETVKIKKDIKDNKA
jgi:hypothetical protein